MILRMMMMKEAVDVRRLQGANQLDQEDDISVCQVLYGLIVCQLEFGGCRKSRIVWSLVRQRFIEDY